LRIGIIANAVHDFDIPAQHSTRRCAWVEAFLPRLGWTGDLTPTVSWIVPPRPRPTDDEAARQSQQ
jgi:hypothetical protein